MATSEPGDPIVLHPDTSAALDLFPSEENAAPAPPAPPVAPLFHVSDDRTASARRRVAEGVPRLDGALEPEPVPPLAIAAAAIAVTLFVLMGVAVFFQQRTIPIAGTPPAPVETPSAAQRQAPIATVPIASVNIDPAAAAAAAAVRQDASRLVAPPKPEVPNSAVRTPPPARTPPRARTPPAGRTQPSVQSQPPVRTASNTPRTSQTRKPSATTSTPAPALVMDFASLPTAPPIVSNPASLDEVATPRVLTAPAATVPAAAEHPAPIPASATPPTPSRDQQIRGVLQQYATALSQLDVNLTRAVWPTVDASTLRRAYSQLASQRVELGACQINAGDQYGSAVCAGRVTVVPRIGRKSELTESRTWMFDIARRGDRWVISSVRAQ